MRLSKVEREHQGRSVNPIERLRNFMAHAPLAVKRLHDRATNAGASCPFTLEVPLNGFEPHVMRGGGFISLSEAFVLCDPRARLDGACRQKGWQIRQPSDGPLFASSVAAEPVVPIKLALLLPSIELPLPSRPRLVPTQERLSVSTRAHHSPCVHPKLSRAAPFGTAEQA